MAPKPASTNTVSPARTLSLKTGLILIGVSSLVTAIVVSGLVAGLFLVIQSSASGSLEQRRQVIVEEGEVIADVAQKVSPSVVSIATQQPASSSTNQAIQRPAAGTGIVMSSDGLILTNKHVIPEGTTGLEVILADGTRYQAVEIVGRDPLNDLAFLKITNPKELVPARLGDSDQVRQGQKVIAIGNALGQYQNTVTAGIISGTGRPVQADDAQGRSEQLSNLFQTDTAINFGNSGGPLVDYQGRVIGVNTAIAQDAQNIGFAIPINEAKGLLESIQTTGKISRPFIGVRYVSLTPEVARRLGANTEQGAYITTEGGVIAGSPAEQAGLSGGDIITKVQNIPLNERISLISALSRFKVGQTINLTVIKNGQSQVVSVTLAEAPAQ